MTEESLVQKKKKNPEDLTLIVTPTIQSQEAVHQATNLKIYIHRSSINLSSMSQIYPSFLHFFIVVCGFFF